MHPPAAHLERFLRHTGPITWDAEELAACTVDPAVARVLHAAVIIEDDTAITARHARSFGLGRSADLAGFLDAWEEEEAEHAHSLRALLEHQRYDAPRPPPTSISRRRRLLARVPARLVGRMPPTELVLCALGAAAEHSALVTYTELAKRTDQPAVTRLLRAILRQEGSHLAFFLAAAQERGATMSATSGRLARRAVSAIWEPVGVPSLGPELWHELFAEWLADDEVVARLEGMDRVIDAIPHLEGLALMHRFLQSAASGPAAARAAQNRRSSPPPST
jgi:rubrerythrin